MKVTAPFDAYVPDLIEPMLEADPLDPAAGQVKQGETYEVPGDIGKSLAAQGWKSSGTPGGSSKPRVSKGKPNP
jgi:hypothetical protein